MPCSSTRCPGRPPYVLFPLTASLRKQPIWAAGDTPHLMPVEQGLPWHPVATGLAGQAIPFIVAASHAHALPFAPFWFPVPAVLVASPALLCPSSFLFAVLLLVWLPRSVCLCCSSPCLLALLGAHVAHPLLSHLPVPPYEGFTSPYNMDCPVRGWLVTALLPRPHPLTQPHQNNHMHLILIPGGGSDPEGGVQGVHTPFLVLWLSAVPLRSWDVCCEGSSTLNTPIHPLRRLLSGPLRSPYTVAPCRLLRCSCHRPLCRRASVGITGRRHAGAQTHQLCRHVPDPMASRACLLVVGLVVFLGGGGGTS